MYCVLDGFTFFYEFIPYFTRSSAIMLYYCISIENRYDVCTGQSSGACKHLCCFCETCCLLFSSSKVDWSLLEAHCVSVNKNVLNRCHFIIKCLQYQKGSIESVLIFGNSCVLQLMMENWYSHCIFQILTINEDAMKQLSCYRLMDL